MKILKLTICFVLFSIISATSQSTIKGMVTDENGPLGFVNMVLHALPDSNTITVVATDIEGRYEITAIEDGNYYLEALMLSYEDLKSESFELKNEEITLNMNMVEETNMLNTVEITAKVPLMEQKADRLVVNVAKSLNSIKLQKQPKLYYVTKL